jgi:hypothetical protein
MSGHREPRAKEKYQFNMTVSAAALAEPVKAPQNQVSPVGWASDEDTEAQSPIEETVAVMMASSERDENAAVAMAPPEPELGVSVIPLADEGNLEAFKSNPKSKSSLDLRGGLLSNRLRVLSVAGWSGLAAVGALLILTGPASVISVRLAELGGVWAAITATIWLLTSKLKT